MVEMGKVFIHTRNRLQYRSRDITQFKMKFTRGEQEPLSQQNSQVLQNLIFSQNQLIVTFKTWDNIESNAHKL